MLGLLALGVLTSAQKPLPVDGSHQQEQTQPHVDKAPLVAPPPCASEVCKENAENTERFAYYEAHPNEYLKAAIAPANLSNWILAFLGVIGGVVAVITLFLIKRQADIMETQANDARESGAQTFAVLKEQTDNLLISAKAATVSAMAAEESSKAANAQIKMVRDKERARISVSVTANELEISPSHSFDVIPIEITNYGVTSAFGVRAKADIFGQPGDDVPYMGNFIPLSIPSVIKANSEVTRAEVILVQDIDMSGFENSPIPYFFHISGSVEYDDVFGDAHITTFRFKFKVDAAQPIAESRRWRVRSLREWKMCGSSEENRAT